MQDPVLGLRRSVGPQHVAGTGSFLGSPGLCSWRPWPCSPVGSATSCRLLRAILNTAVTDGLLQKSACQVKGAGQVRSSERPIASVAELAGAVDAAPERYQLAILLCAWCHLRRGEMLALQRRDVDPLHGTIRVERAWVTPQSGALMLGAPQDRGWQSGPSYSCQRVTGPGKSSGPLCRSGTGSLAFRDQGWECHFSPQLSASLGSCATSRRSRGSPPS